MISAYYRRTAIPYQSHTKVHQRNHSDNASTIDRLVIPRVTMTSRMTVSPSSRREKHKNPPTGIEENLADESKPSYSPMTRKTKIHPYLLTNQESVWV